MIIRNKYFYYRTRSYFTGVNDYIYYIYLAGSRKYAIAIKLRFYRNAIYRAIDDNIAYCSKCAVIYASDVQTILRMDKFISEDAVTED